MRKSIQCQIEHAALSAVVIHWEIRVQTKVHQLSPDYLRLRTRKLQALPRYAGLFLCYFILNITCTPNRTKKKIHFL